MLTRKTLISIHDAAASETIVLYGDPIAPMMGRVAGIMAVEDALGIHLESHEIDACQTAAEIVDTAIRKVEALRSGAI